ncbi:methane monooxygenase [Candidatus Mycolicibacterium alkanivorans]|uniref:Methane monooxygenase n=1 Tax=Candidatus Mycolicibacterium alkanivorans TaxID=2954114 RepID=A0ABS9YYQ7_9MYCO|nr:methane monooxygenase [Candidatus Mycolicibacterium alkanivorans]MCI4676364.1 methane monooxygenase [Candidatus Mycolicibacterium alkanivorans]
MADEQRTARRRSRERETTTAGAEWRLEPSPWGDTALRAEWAARADALTTLDEAVAALMKYRTDHWGLEDQNTLWIEARLEERVAVLRLESASDEDFRNRTLTGEDAREICASVAERSTAAGDDYKEIERINDEFRSRYKPPIMATNLFVPAEIDLCEKLMKTRMLDWYGKSMEELRADRGVVVHAAP